MDFFPCLQVFFKCYFVANGLWGLFRNDRPVVQAMSQAADILGRLAEMFFQDTFIDRPLID